LNIEKKTRTEIQEERFVLVKYFSGTGEPEFPPMSAWAMILRPESRKFLWLKEA
jgi:hypothetical protein